jgi:hypothetical protein
LKELFHEAGVLIHTADLISPEESCFELHLNAQSDGRSDAALLMLEPAQVWPLHSYPDRLRDYKKIFTWDDQLVDGDKFVKINFPNPLSVVDVPSFQQRDRFCCLIAGNKALAVLSSDDLYQERIRAIRWFEVHEPDDFDLYGMGWNLPAFKRGGLHKLHRFLYQHLQDVLNLRPFPSYRGAVVSKASVLRRTKFSVCYENVGGLSGYITEKIFDCFLSGCIPVYWGASNVADHIPADCFVDRRQFSCIADVYKYLKSMPLSEYEQYQVNIRQFLVSDNAKSFGHDEFASIIVQTILSEFKLEK